MRDFEYQDEDAPPPGAFSDDILPIDIDRDLERVRRWIHNFQSIRAVRPLTPPETEGYNEVCAEEDRLLEIRIRRHAASGGAKSWRAGTDREPLREEYEELGEFVLAHSAWQLRTRGWDTLDHEPRPENFSDPETFAGVHQAWEDRQIERVRQQVARNQEVFGGVPGQTWQARTAPADGVDNVLRRLLKPSVILGGPKACKHCGEEQAHYIQGQAGLVPRACHCDRSKTAHHVQATLACDMLELDWQAEGFTFAGAIKEENARRLADWKEQHAN